MWALRNGTHTVLTSEGGAILDERTGRWTYLTPTAADVVMLLCTGHTAGEAATVFADRYRIPPAQAVRDVRAVADQLAAAGLATTTSPVRRRWWRWGR